MRGAHRLRQQALNLVLAFVALTGLLSLAAQDKAPAPVVQEGSYVGIDQCAACHEDTAAAFRASIHGQKGFEMRSGHSCETCHGPGKAHVDAGGGKGSMVIPTALPKDKQSAICLTCHERGSRTDWSGSFHDARGVSCLDCHSIHKPVGEKAQLKERETDLCFTCHTQKKSQFYRASHHPVREGLMTCSDCHNPHAVQDGRLIDQSAVTELCYRCHTEKRGPFLWEHVPVREDCMNCHEVHGSNHMKMLKAKEPFLCQRCHSDTRHPGTLYDQSQLLVDSNRLFGRSCTNCHSTLHGSNNPSGKTFLR
jgi:DmsE family decaheme c-type cytochrome